MKADAEQLEWMEALLRQVAASRSYRQSLATVRSTIASEPRARMLGAILMVEMSARSAWWRAAEWIMWFVGSALHVPPRWVPQTRGPFQLFDAPYRLEAAVQRADLHLAEIPPDLTEVARQWHGASARQPGSRVAYAGALALALTIIDHRGRESTR